MCFMVSFPALAWDKIGPTLQGERYNFGDTGICSEIVTAVKENGLWGFIKSDGKVVIKPKYEEIGEPSYYENDNMFSDRTLKKAAIPVKLNGKWGFVGQNGKEIIKPKYDSVGNFSTYTINNKEYNGKVSVCKDGKSFVINQKDKIIENLRNDEGDFFDEVETSAQNKILQDGRILHKGVYYTLEDATKEATVVTNVKDEWSKDFKKYKGDIYVDSVVTFNGTSYAVTKIGKKAFHDCRDLTSLSLPKTIREIENEAFCGTLFVELRIPENVEKIGYRAFGACDYLTVAFMPETLKDVIGGFIFGGDYNLEKIIFPSQEVVDRLGKDIIYLTDGVKNAKVYVNDKLASIFKRADLPIEAGSKYGKFYWKDNQLENEKGTVIIAAKQWDKIYFLNECIILKKNNKFGAYSYTGKQIVAPIYEKFLGLGKEDRFLFSNSTPNGEKFFVLSKNGALLASRAFTNSQAYSFSQWMKDWLYFIREEIQL